MVDTPTPGNGFSEAIRHAAPYTPIIAGAVLSMAFGEKLTIRGKILSAIVGLCAAQFIAPFLVDIVGLFWPGDGVPVSVVSVIGFACGAFGMIILSGLAQAAAKYSKDPLSLVRVNLGPVSIGGKADEEPAP
jgi:hypothetical protein